MIVNKTKNKDKFKKIISFFLIGVFAFLLAFMPFLMNKKTDKVMADSVVTGSDVSYYSSTTILPVNLVPKNSVNAGSMINHDPIYLSLSFVLSNLDGGDIYFDTTGLTNRAFYYQRVSWVTFPASLNPSLNSSGFTKGPVSTSFVFTYDSWQSLSLYVVGLSSSSSDLYRIFGNYYIESGFNFNVLRCSITSGSSYNGSYHGNGLKIYDTNNRTLTLQFPLSNNNYNNWGLLYNYAKDYYLVDTTNLNDNQFYDQGYDDGFNAGYSSGESSGYNNGYNAGYSSGESSGYNEGLQAGSDVSFLNLVGATIDAPVQAFNGLFDFNIDLGGSSFNLKNFLIALLTIALIIAFVRLIMAK